MTNQPQPTHENLHRDNQHIKFVLYVLAVLIGLIAFLAQDKLKSIDTSIQNVDTRTESIDKKQVSIQTQLDVLGRDVGKLQDGYDRVKQASQDTDSQTRVLEQKMQMELQQIRWEVDKVRGDTQK